MDKPEDQARLKFSQDRLEKLGNALRIERKKRRPKLTQDGLATAIGVDRKTISRIENAEGEASLAVLDALGKYFGKSLDEIVPADVIVVSPIGLPETAIGALNGANVIETTPLANVVDRPADIETDAEAIDLLLDVSLQSLRAIGTFAEIVQLHLPESVDALSSLQDGLTKQASLLESAQASRW